jgi:hypothetical protein
MEYSGQIDGRVDAYRPERLGRRESRYPASPQHDRLFTRGIVERAVDQLHGILRLTLGDLLGVLFGGRLRCDDKEAVGFARRPRHDLRTSFSRSKPGKRGPRRKYWVSRLNRKLSEDHQWLFASLGKRNEGQ